MKNKIIAGLLGILSFSFFYLTYNQYIKMQASAELYQELGNSIPPEFNLSILIMLIPAIIALIYAIKFIRK